MSVSSSVRSQLLHSQAGSYSGVSSSVSLEMHQKETTSRVAVETLFLSTDRYQDVEAHLGSGTLLLTDKDLTLDQPPMAKDTDHLGATTMYSYMRRKTSKLWAKKDGHTGDPITYRKGEAADLIKPFYQFMISKYSQPVVPVEATTPKFISEQIAKGQAILGLTARGPAYVKDSLRELGEAGYDLKNNPILKDSGHVVLNGTASDPVSVIADGVVFCGKTSKGEVLSTINERYLVNSNIDTVILIDDRLGNVNEFIATVSKAKGIKKVIGVHYKAVKTPHLKDEVATKLIKDVFSEFPVWAEKYSYLLGSTAA